MSERARVVFVIGLRMTKHIIERETQSATAPLCFARGQ